MDGFLFAAWVIATFALAKSINVLSFGAARAVMTAVSGAHQEGGSIAELAVHHGVQLGITLCLVALCVSRFKVATWRQFGFTAHGWRPSVRGAVVFVGVWAVVQFGVGWYLVSRGHVGAVDYRGTAANLVATYLFQLLLSGVGEEPLYRGLVLVSVYVASRRVIDRDGQRMAVAILVSTAVFMFDHVNFGVQPLSVTHINWLQQATLLVFGVFYGWLFARHRTLIGPVVAHGLLNVVIVTSGIVFSIGGQG